MHFGAILKPDIQMLKQIGAAREAPISFTVWSLEYYTIGIRKLQFPKSDKRTFSNFGEGTNRWVRVPWGHPFT